MSAAAGHEDDADLPFRVRGEATQDATVLALEGDLDIVSAHEAGQALSRAQAAGGTVILDLRRLRFMDSSGLRVVLEAQRRAASAGERARLQVAPGEGDVRRVFDVSGVGGLIEIVDGP